MSGCCDVCACEPCSCCASGFTDPTTIEQAHTLAGSLICQVDQIRDMYACMGTRSYSVWTVRTRWSGGERGLGVEQLVEEKQILPVPRVGNIDAIDRTLQAVGIVEQGSVRVDQISARYTEDELLGFVNGHQIPEDQQFYWEIRGLEVSGKPPQRRRFTPRANPMLDRMNFQWIVRLERQHADRGRAGDAR